VIEWIIILAIFLFGAFMTIAGAGLLVYFHARGRQRRPPEDEDD
jgi:hypothetical protein